MQILCSRFFCVFCHSLTSESHQIPNGNLSKTASIPKSDHSPTYHSSKPFSLVLGVFSLLAIFSLFSHPFHQLVPIGSISPQNSPKGHNFTEQIYKNTNIQKGDAIRIGRALASGELGQYCLQRATLFIGHTVEKSNQKRK